MASSNEIPIRPTVDLRQDQRQITLLERFFGEENVTIEKIDVGDIIVGKEFGAEIKKPGDYIQSVKSKRIFSQVDELVANFENPFLIIEGNPEDLLMYRGGMDASSVIGSQASLMCHHGVKLLFTGSYDREKKLSPFMMFYLEKLIRKSTDKKITTYNPIRRKATKKENALNILYGLPGVKGKNANRLLDHFGSIWRVINASIEELMQVEGIGKTKALEIYNLIHEEFVYLEV